MTQERAPLIVTGPPGAGKTALAAHLAAEEGAVWLLGPSAVALAIDRALLREAGVAGEISTDSVRPEGARLIIEADAFAEPAESLRLAGLGPVAMVSVVDALSLSGQLADPVFGPLVARQIRAAALVVVTKGDLADPAPALSAIAALTDAPVTVAERARIDPGAVTALRPAPAPAPSAPVPVRRWSYQGPAVLDREGLDALLRRPPEGADRIKGVARLAATGLAAQKTGPLCTLGPLSASPSETLLSVSGPVDRLRARDLDARLADLAAGAAYHGNFYRLR